MKHVLLYFLLSILFVGCNMNPNKEERIQDLESKVKALELKIQKLEQD